MTTPEPRTSSPQRTCIGCRTTRSPHEMVRCAFDGERARVGRAASGRGAWLCSLECYRAAMQRNAFDKSWKRRVPTATVQSLADALHVAFEQEVKQLKPRKG